MFVFGKMNFETQQLTHTVFILKFLLSHGGQVSWRNKDPLHGSVLIVLYSFRILGPVPMAKTSLHYGMFERWMMRCRVSRVRSGNPSCAIVRGRGGGGGGRRDRRRCIGVPG